LLFCSLFVKLYEAKTIKINLCFKKEEASFGVFLKKKKFENYFAKQTKVLMENFSIN